MSCNLCALRESGRYDGTLLGLMGPRWLHTRELATLAVGLAGLVLTDERRGWAFRPPAIAPATRRTALNILDLDACPMRRRPKWAPPRLSATWNGDEPA